MPNHHHHHLLQHKTKPKAPTAADAAAQQLTEQIASWAARWEVQAAVAGRADAAAMLCTAKSLQQLSTHLSHHRTLCKRGDVRAQLLKHVLPQLLTNLLGGSSNSSDNLISLVLEALAVFARCLPALVPAEAFAPRLLELLCGGSGHSTSATDGAAKVLLLQLSTWRFSEVWPHWTAAGATAFVFEQLQGLCAAVESGRAGVDGSGAGVCQLSLLARLAELREQEVVRQLAGNTQLARDWLQLLLRLERLRKSMAASPASLQLQDSVCLLLAALSRAPGTAPCVLAAAHAQLLPLLHRVLHRPTSWLAAEVPKCWTHAAQAASLPALWQPQPAAAAAADATAHEQQTQLLSDIAAAAACAFYVSSPQNSQLAATNASAAGVLAAALLPASDSMFGSRRACASRCLTSILSSDNCHVLLHSLASCADDASNSNKMAWSVLRMVCAQIGSPTHCNNTSGSNSDADGGDVIAAAAAAHTGSRHCSDGIQAEQLHRVVQAYSCFVRNGVSNSCLLGSLRVLLCHAALAVRRQQHERQQPQEPHHGGQAGSDQLMRAAETLLERLHGHAAQACSIGGCGDARQLSWQLLAAVYSTLAVTVFLCEHKAELSGQMCAVALSTVSLAASALRILLPLPGRPDAVMQEQVLLPDGTWECCLAALQVLALLGRMARNALPTMLASVEHHGGASVHSARAGAAQARAALDCGLQQLLSGLVAAAGASSELRASSSSSSSSSSFTSIEATLQLNSLQELGGWAAAALTACYGQLGASGWQGAALADLRKQGALFSDVVVQLGSDLQLPAHAHGALLAAGSPVLQQQLLQARASGANGADGRSSSLVLKFSASLQESSVQLALDYLYSGQAQVPSSGLASQLPVCAAALDAAAAVAAGHSSQSQKSALQQQQQALMQQLKDQHAASREQLSVLARLAKRLQLPLLAAVCKDSVPQPGQQLQVLHPRLTALLPQQLLLLAGAATDTDSGQQQDQQVLCSLPELVGRHQPCSAYLQLLAEWQAAPLPAAHHLDDCDQQLSDVLLMVPALVAVPPANAAAAASAAAADDAPQQEQQQQQAVAVSALLPTHRAVLAAGCPYFGTLLSDRWQAAGGHVAPVLAVPEADVHVAAALVAFLCTGTLQVALPGEVRALPASAAGAVDGQTTSLADRSDGCATSQQQSSSTTVLLSGCCGPCHRARTLLRVWRCAELLLLPALQQLCLAAVEAATWELRSECCLALLDDCWHLGAAAAADGIAASLVSRGDQHVVAGLPGWSTLQPCMRDALVRTWAEQQQQPREGDEHARGAAAAAAAKAAAGMHTPLPTPVLQAPSSLERPWSSPARAAAATHDRQQQQEQEKPDRLLQAAGALHRLLRPVLAQPPAGA